MSDETLLIQANLQALNLPSRGLCQSLQILCLELSS